jgi:hypothetical protein
MGTTFDVSCHNTFEFLRVVPKYCNRLVTCGLWMSMCESNLCAKLMFDIIKSQPLEKLYIVVNKLEEYAKKCIYASEFRSETLRELSFDSNYCYGFTSIT